MPVELRVAEQELDRLALELWAKHENQFIPLRPWVFVRVLPREHKIGSLWTPDTKSTNKPMHEGIVLKTWEPYRTTKYKHSQILAGDGKPYPICDDIVTYHKSDLKPGEHVIYPHFAGMPVPGWDERYYRVVPEHVKTDRGIDWNGIIFGKLNYPAESVREVLEELIGSGTDCEDNQSNHNFEEALNNILANFDVIPKTLGSKTLSGR